MLMAVREAGGRRALSQLGMRAPAEHDNVADHGAGWSGGGVLSSKVQNPVRKGQRERLTPRRVGGARARARARAGRVMGLFRIV